LLWWGVIHNFTISFDTRILTDPHLLFLVENLLDIIFDSIIWPLLFTPSWWKTLHKLFSLIILGTNLSIW